MAWPSAPQQWQSRTWQDSCHVTGVTESVLRRGDFTPFLQLANLICAIAPPGQGPRRNPRTTPVRPSRGEGAQSRTDPSKLARDPHGARTEPTGRPVFSPREARAAGTRQDSRRPHSAQKRSRWTRRSPARSHDKTRMAQVWRPLGRTPVIWSYGWAMWVGGPKSPVVTRRQGYVRPRCAAAEYPQAVRGPLPRGTGDVHRACGWT